MKLNNGATVLDMVRFMDMRGVVAEYRGEYVVWRCYPDGKGGWECLWGNYHKTYQDAIKCFRDRFFPN